MSLKRRDFIKLAGLAAAAGLGGYTLHKPGAEIAEASGGSAPATGTRWGMTIDVFKMEDADYKRVTEACDKLHNIPKWEDRQKEIKWIWTDDYHHSFPGQEDPFLAEHVEQETFLLMCNHCERPPCVRVCPTQATFKRPDGVVMMDYHRCIGCRFCMAACPYGARSFNLSDPRLALDLKKINRDFPTRTKGVVEKCNFCAERLAIGLKPACAEASNGAMVFGDLNDPHSDVRQVLKHNFAIRRKTELGTSPSVYYLIK